MVRLFQECLEWKAEQKIVWAKVCKETGRWTGRWKILDRLEDGRQSGCCRLPVHDGFGGIVPVCGGAFRELCVRWEHRERREWKEEREAEELGAARKLGAREATPPLPYALV